MTRSDHLNNIVQQIGGIHYETPTAISLLDSADWGDYYPEVDHDGYLTGDVIGIGEEGYINVCDEVYVRLDTLSPEQLHAQDTLTLSRPS